MLVARVGFAPVKGTRHRAHDAAELTVRGPTGDRAFCLVDLAAGRVLRSVENPALVQAVASLSGAVLRVELPAGYVEDEVPGSPGTGPVHRLDYWGRTAQVELLDGPWSAALSEHLGREVRLARPRASAQIVYAGAVTLVGTGSLDRLATALGGVQVDSARFRSTLLVDTGDLPPHVEDDWVGHRLRVGEVVLRVTGRVPRCAVVDSDPVSGSRDAPVLAALAGYRRADGEVLFGVDAEVTTPGRVHAGDRVTWERN